MTTTILTAPKHYQGKEVTYPPLFNHGLPPMQRASLFAYSKALATLGYPTTSVFSRTKSFRKADYIATKGAYYFFIGFNGAVDKYELTLPVSKKTVEVDVHTFGMIATILSMDMVMQELDKTPYLDFKDEIYRDFLIDMQFDLLVELFDYEMMMTDEEKRFAKVLKPIVDELRKSLM